MNDKFYNDKLYVEQLQSGEAFNRINKSISVSILNFNLLENEIDIHNVYRFSNVKSFNQLTDIKELHFIELKKFDKNKPRVLMTKFEKWLSLIKIEELIMQNLPFNIKEEPEIYQAFMEMQKANSDPKIRELIEIREKAEHDEASRLLTAELKGYNNGEKSGLKKGIEKGEKIGIEKGEKIGIEKGTLSTKIMIINKLFEIGVDLNKIAQSTQLPIEKVKYILGLEQNDDNVN